MKKIYVVVFNNGLETTIEASRFEVWDGPIAEFYEGKTLVASAWNWSYIAEKELNPR